MKSLPSLLFFLIPFFSFSQPGTLDPTFGNGGIVFTDLAGNGPEICYSLAVQADGKIVAGGIAYINGVSEKFSIIRYNPGGSLDASFGDSGIVTTSLGVNTNFKNLSLTADGKIVVAADHGISDDSSAVVSLIKYLPDGSPDSTFGDDGIVDTDISQSVYSEFGGSLAILPDGKILSLANFDGGYLAVMKHQEDGSLDTTFAGDGIATFDINLNALYGSGIVAQSDGKIVIAGYNGNPFEPDDFRLTRLFPDGTRDSTFGINGIVTTALTGEWDYPKVLLLQPDDKLIAFGTAGNCNILCSPDPHFGIVRYNANGSLDQTFNGDGKFIFQIENDWSYGAAATLQPDGKMLMTGNGSYSYDLALVRLNSDGTFDNTFGDGGIITTAGVTGQALALQSDGKIVTGGSGGTGNIFIGRYLNDLPFSPCVAPEGLNSGPVSTTAQKLEWDNAANATGYKVRYKISGSSSWAKLHAVSNNKVIQNLLPNTTYVWQTKSICSVNPLVQSQWSSKKNFTTPLKINNSEQEENQLSVYPNPVSSLATIQFFLTGSDEIKIELLDMQGRKIKTIAEGNFEAGNHQLNFSAANLTAGVYLLQLCCTSHIESQKLIIH